MKPVSVGFNLDKASNIQSGLRARFSYKGKQFLYSTGIIVLSENWEKSKQRMNPKKEFGWEVNDQLDEISKVIKKVVISLYIHKSDVITSKQMKFLIDAARQAKQEEAKPVSSTNSVKEFFEDWITKKSKGKDGYFKRRWKTTVNNALEIYPLLRFTDINEAFFSDYVENLADVEQNVNNTINGKVKRMQQLCREAMKYGYTVNPHFNDFRFPGEKLPPVYLTWKEVEKIEQQDPDFYSDAFLFRCYTGVRFSDMKNLNQYMIQKNGGKMVLRFDIVKQRKHHLIFLPKQAYNLWKRNDFNWSRNRNQTENEQIKIIAKRAKLRRLVQIMRHRNDKLEVKQSPIFDIISTHMARRTFAREWYERGGDLNKLREYLGHAELATTLNYIGVENDEVNNEASRLFG
ncbi:hypothetical protein DN752_19460 [Echinicola strongylocentroti]|uniref:Tyr recombinase domain-containing protein n=1 Tax=Echinicola strongylocentroti TaxID=1795355 RepID=A0A2Z4ILZ4_9BACT|nr:tyrosine-type recombinase/integrase [Echinicola strongylocentroti]AWW32141.1 hypothetical protein DN752_19460 [Echinicola strongylocentroti]